MRIKIRPVRWWRDDATRYQSRGAYKAPVDEGPRFELPPELRDPEIEAMLAAVTNARDEARVRWDAAVRPIEDVLAAQQECRRLHERQSLREFEDREAMQIRYRGLGIFDPKKLID